MLFFAALAADLLVPSVLRDPLVTITSKTRGGLSGSETSAEMPIEQNSMATRCQTAVEPDGHTQAAKERERCNSNPSQPSLIRRGHQIRQDISNRDCPVPRNQERSGTKGSKHPIAQFIQMPCAPCPERRYYALE